MLSEYRRAFVSVVFGIHLLLVVSVSIRRTGWLIRSGLTVVPWSTAAAKSVPEDGARNRGDKAPVRNVVVTYLHLTGIEAAYGYFAPNIPRSYALVVDVHSPDGEIERVPLTFAGHEESLRWSSLLDYIGHIAAPEIREVILKLIAHSVRSLYPQAMTIRLTLEKLSIPAPKDFQKGQRESHETVAAYDFTFATVPSAPAP